MAITYHQSNKILDYEFGNTSYTPVSTLYFGLSTTSISNGGSGASEPSVGAYARVAVANSDKTNWSLASNGSLSNTTTIQFPESTASWGIITHVFIADALTGGNILYFGTLSPNRTVAINTIVYFSASAVTISIVNS